MSDLSSEPNEDQAATLTEAKRPGVVLLLAVLIFLAALAQFVSAIAMIVLALRPGDAQELFGAPVSDWYWILTAALTVVLGLIYIWMGRGMLSGNSQAWILLNLIAIINIFFSVFQIATGVGWATMLINIVILGLNNTVRVRIWFRLV